eukprot:CAMPEP_0172728368 /NCGR_PEP_ID=MMETSP1074-20121228/92204_1 /TAXON_ID=2916 /ORGANISM="Ceratium fusus, Strain PA161109" /LENGTH=190 /DNA_ID=CAMNT_0013555613 /DNA_START=363 /DNA_END=936 /DNA_ORIENTATION=-
MPRPVLIPPAEPHLQTDTNERGDDKCRKEHRRGGEANKEVVIPLADAIVHKWAVMVKPHHAMVAVPAVRCSWRSNNLTCVAPTVTTLAKTGCHHFCCVLNGIAAGHHALRAKQIMSQQRRDIGARAGRKHQLTPGDDPGIAAACRQEKDDCCNKEHQGCQWKQEKWLRIPSPDHVWQRHQEVERGRQQNT